MVSTRYEYKEPESRIEREAVDGAQAHLYSDGALAPSLCSQRKGGMTCTRSFGHKGWHVAAGQKFVYLRWPDASWSRAHRARKAMYRMARGER